MSSVLKVLVLGEPGRGLSTIAALITKTLLENNIPCLLVDHDSTSPDADELLDPKNMPRLIRNTASISGRERAANGTIVVETKIARQPNANPEFA